MITPETPPPRGPGLQRRYATADLCVLTEDERTRFVGIPPGDPQTDVTLAWELLYRLEPELYDRLVSAERLHPGVIGWLPRNVERIVEVAAGTGRLTLELLQRAREVVAIEPAGPLREILNQKLTRADGGDRVQVKHGFFDELPVSDAYADVVVACSAFTLDPAHGGEAGLVEMERVCKPGGSVVIICAGEVAWLAARGYRYVSFDRGEMSVEFASHDEAVELTGLFYPRGVDEVLRHKWRRVPYEVLGINPPCDLAFKMIA